jgi:catechol-2,3-dioxygenase
VQFEIDRLVSQFQDGRLTRRQLVGRMVGLVAAAAGVVNAGTAAEPEASTFQARELNHIALRVTDIDRSVRFYRHHLGLRVLSRGTSTAFLDCGPHFVALFRRDEPGMDHYCYTIDGYDQKDAAGRLRAVGLEPELVSDRIYFRDPDGLRVQLAAPNEGR